MIDVEQYTLYDPVLKLMNLPGDGKIKASQRHQGDTDVEDYYSRAIISHGNGEPLTLCKLAICCCR